MDPCSGAGTRTSIIAALAYAVTVLICVWLLKHPLADAPPVWRALVALVPMAPITWMIRIQVATMLARDELQRRIDLEAIAIASIGRSEEHTSELQSLMRISYAVFCLQKKN